MVDIIRTLYNIKAILWDIFYEKKQFFTKHCTWYISIGLRFITDNSEFWILAKRKRKRVNKLKHLQAGVSIHHILSKHMSYNILFYRYIYIYIYYEHEFRAQSN